MFYMAYGVVEHGSYFVDALWGHTELLKDWSVMTDLLLEVELSQAEESFLIELLTCCALRAAGGSPPPGRVYKKIVGNKERKIISTVSCVYLFSPYGRLCLMDTAYWVIFPKQNNICIGIEVDTK